MTFTIRSPFWQFRTFVLYRNRIFCGMCTLESPIPFLCTPQFFPTLRTVKSSMPPRVTTGLWQLQIKVSLVANTITHFSFVHQEQHYLTDRQQPEKCASSKRKKSNYARKQGRKKKVGYWEEFWRKENEGNKNYMERQKGKTADMHLSTKEPEGTQRQTRD